jgi:hypothetical protein
MTVEAAARKVDNMPRCGCRPCREGEHRQDREQNQTLHRRFVSALQSDCTTVMSARCLDVGEQIGLVVELVHARERLPLLGANAEPT